MFRLRVAVCFIVAAILSACGGTGFGTNGNYLGNLEHPDGSQDFAFMMSLSQGSGTTLDVSSFQFTTPVPCFSDSTTETANLDSSGNFSMTISAVATGGATNTISMHGQRDSQGNFQGSWTLTGFSGCSSKGIFQLHGIPPV